MSQISHLPPVLPGHETPSAPRPPRRLIWFGAGTGIFLVAALLGVIIWAGSSGCEDLIRKRLIRRVEAATGGRVEIASFHWHLLDLDAEAGGLVIHGREAAGEAPYARVDHLHVRISILGFLSPRILLRDLEAVHPAIHLIVYADGSTNQPRPRKPLTNEPALSTLFDLQAEHVALEQGTLDFENRAAEFDFQNRLLRLDFAANDVSMLLSYVPAHGSTNESYQIEAGARDFRLTRGDAARPVAQPVEGYAQATLDLMRNGAYLRSLRLTERSRGLPERTLSISGSLIDFSRPRWQATAQGELDMRVLEPVTGYPNSPEGIARVDLTGQGEDGQFRIDGAIHVDDGSYVAPGVNARGVRLDSHVHADPEQLLITQVVARLRQGGQLEGTVALDHWLLPIPGAPVMEPATQAPAKKRWRFGRKEHETAKVLPSPVHTEPVTIPVNGKVTAQLKNVTIDTVLDIVGQKPFQRLGIDGRLNGPAIATWADGDTETLAVSAQLSVSPSIQAVAGESPGTGVIDGTYTQHDGAVDLRNLDIALPSSHIVARGHLGAYPVESATAISVDFESSDLGEFDAVLRDLGFEREGKTGSGALPATLAGKAEFHGTWAGSLVDPRLAGHANATNLSIELPPSVNETSGKPRYVHWDSVDATGTYSAARITIEHGHFVHGPASIAIEGSLAAPAVNARAATPSFDSNSLLNVHLNASEVPIEELWPVVGKDLPVSGRLNTHFEIDGPIHALEGSGWVELNRSVIDGQPVSHIRAQGKIVGRAVHLDSFTVSDEAGKLAGSGTYNFQSKEFQVTAQGTDLDVSRIQRLQEAGAGVTGSLAFNLAGSGTIQDPHLQAQGMFTGLTLGGEPVGGVQIVAHTANRNLIYDLTSRFESASISAHGQTALSAEYFTQARLDFSQFNIGAFLKMAHVPELNGQSQLAGTVTIEGPLAKPGLLRGDARLENLAVTISGVHLHNEGPVHASLANSRAVLDPLRVTGEQTDLQVKASIDFKANRQLDLAANGSINLKLAETLDPDLTASGTTTFQVEAHGPLENPGLRGRVDIENASLALEDLPNSLSQLHGTLEFNKNRLEIKSLTAMTGGGQLNVYGFLAYQRGIFADLSVTGKGIRIRYPQGISALADANLQLQGPRNNLLLSGGIMITRFSVSPDLDIAALATQTSKVQPVAAPDAPSNHVRMDVHIQSSPQLNFQNAYAKLAGDVDLRLRGTLATPSLLGRVSVTEGSATIAGTRYELQRGDITFTNPVRIEPSIDLNATARVEDYDITLGLHGSPSKLNVSYRSDPPLPEADVVALLALGRTQNEQQIYGQQQMAAVANPTTEALLGGALNATVSSRVQRLFGAGSVKVDPNYLGVLGNSTTRITVEEQLGKNLTLTYATDVNTTAQQLLQAEVAINRHISLLIARDENGVFSMVLKATRRYR
jgi:translocation and assembly module TamB